MESCLTRNLKSRAHISLNTQLHRYATRLYKLATA